MTIPTPASTAFTNSPASEDVAASRLRHRAAAPRVPTSLALRCTAAGVLAMLAGASITGPAAEARQSQPKPLILIQAAEPIGGDDAEGGDVEPPPAVDAAAEGAPAGTDAAPAAPLTKEEIDALRAEYDALPLDEQEVMKAYYADLGVQLEQLFGITAAQAAENARSEQLVGAMGGLDYSRKPQAVLGARSKLDFGGVAQPNLATAPPGDVAAWLHLNVLAGEWNAVAAALASRPESEAKGLFNVITKSLARGDANLLPEEILEIAEITPHTPSDQNIVSLAAMLKTAAQKNSTRVLMDRINAGGRIFGKADAAQRRRTVDFLSPAGLVIEAYDFLPPIETARAAADAELLLVHARYKSDLAGKALPGADADQLLDEAWDLFAEVSRLPKATLTSTREAITRNIAMMTQVPRAKATPWLREIFSSPRTSTVALEVLALNADNIGNEELPEDKRADATLLTKEAVDVILQYGSVDAASLRIPLRMLTRSLAGALEGTGKRRENSDDTESTYGSQVLQRAIPDARWLDALEVSLATRVTKAGITVALKGGNTDLGVTLLRDGLRRSPSDAQTLADHFLNAWAGKLSPRNNQSDFFPPWYWSFSRPSAPVTRGKQRRNLEQLNEVMATLATTGVDPRGLPSISRAFHAAHSSTEVYTRDDIVRVFGSLEKIPPSTCIAMASVMGANLSGDWRSREAQQKKGVKRSDTEIARMVDSGYALAIDLVDAAIAGGLDSWRTSALKASLTFDRMQYRAVRQQLTPEEQNAYRVAAFDAFERAALRYADAVAKGQEREVVDVYAQWFSTALGTSQLARVSFDDLPTVGSLQDDQIERIRRAIAALPADAAFRHTSEFARIVSQAVTAVAPEVKPRLVRHALRIINDHPAGASLRSLDQLYTDLLQHEIKLRLTIDGEDRVGTAPFGVMISLRYTNAVERETGGFAQYLQNGVYSNVNGNWRQVNYRDLFRKEIEKSLSKSFTIEAISMFDAFMPANPVRENGESGWLEKPMAYVILARNDATIDRLPQLSLDIQLNDETGPVTLAVASNTPALAVAQEARPPRRPSSELSITQTVDVRNAVESGTLPGERADAKSRSVKLEVLVKGKGVLPDVRDLLENLDTAMPGYAIAADGIVAQPALILQTAEQPAGGRFFFSSQGQPPADGYPIPDDTGMYRLPTEKAWTITYSPVGASSSADFRVPTLKSGIDAKLETRQYADLDIIPVTAATVPVVITRPWWHAALALGVITAIVIAAVWAFRRFSRRTAAPAARAFDVPVNPTPLNTILTLQRYHAELKSRLDPATQADLVREIQATEQRYFGPEAPDADTANADLAGVLRRWSTRLAKQ